jgi:hypothetical protein
MTKFSEKIEQIKSAAKLAGLKINHVTGASNGYPEPETGIAITGFSTFAECAEFCKINGGIEARFESKGGWQMVNYKGEEYCEISTDEQMDHYSSCVIVYSVEQYQSNLLDMIDNISYSGSMNDNQEEMSETFKDIRELIKQSGVISSKINLIIRKGGVVAMNDNEIYEEIYPTMAYNYDNTRSEVGVYFNYLDIRESLESDSE